MKVSIKLAYSLAIATGFSALSLAHANDITKFFGGMVGIGDIDARQSQIERRIVDAVASGRLSRQDADILKRDLDRIAEQEAVYRSSDDKLTMWESVKLTFDLDRLSKDLEARLSDRQVATEDLDYRFADLDRRISDAIASQRLTAQETEEFKYDFGRLKAIHAAMKASTTQPNYSDTLSLSLELDRLSGRLERQMHERYIPVQDIDKRRAELEKKVSDGMSSGRLTEKESTEIKSELARIAQTQAAYKQSNNLLTTEESLVIALDLERLNSRIDMLLSNDQISSHIDFDRRLIALDRRLSEALHSGRIDVPKALELKAEFDRLSQLRSTLKEPQHAGSPLAIDLEKLSQKVERQFIEQQFAWSGIDQKLSELDRRINDAGASGRLSEEEARELRSELDRIRQSRTQFQATDGGMDSGETVTIALDLQRLDRRAHQLMHDRAAAPPNIEARKRELDQLIAGSLADGKLSAQEAQELKSEFDRVLSLEDTFKTSGLSYRENLALALDLERLAARIERKMRERQAPLPSFAARKRDLQKGIDDAVRTQKLSLAQAEALQSQLAQLSDKERTHKADGLFSTAESLAIAQDLDRIAGNIEQSLSTGEYTAVQIDARQSAIDRRIAEGLAQGRLSTDEANQLRKELDRIAAAESAFRESGGLSYGEQLTLALDLERLATRIEQQMHESPISLPDVAARQAKIDRRLAEALLSGKLSLPQADALRVELDRIAQTEAKHRYTGGGLSYAEGLNLSQELDRLETRLNSQLSQQSTAGPGFNQRKAELDRRIASAVASGKLRSPAERELRSELDRIILAESDFRVSAGGLTFAEALTLSRDLDLLSGRLDRMTAKIAIAPQDIGARKTQIQRAISRGLALGKLKPAQAGQFRRELARVNKLELKFKASGGLTPGELAVLGQELDRLSMRLDRQLQFAWRDRWTPEAGGR